jgi:hypothetical protein
MGEQADPVTLKTIAGRRRGLVHLASSARAIAEHNGKIIFSGSLLEIRRVLLDEVLFFCRQIVQGEDRIGRADRNAGSAIDAALRFHVHLRGRFEIGLVLLGVDAVGGADIDAERILDAGISDYVGHDRSLSRMK